MTLEDRFALGRFDFDLPPTQRVLSFEAIEQLLGLFAEVTSRAGDKHHIDQLCVSLDEGTPPTRRTVGTSRIREASRFGATGLAHGYAPGRSRW